MRRKIVKIDNTIIIDIKFMIYINLNLVKLIIKKY